MKAEFEPKELDLAPLEMDPEFAPVSKKPKLVQDREGYVTTKEAMKFWRVRSMTTFWKWVEILEVSSYEVVPGSQRWRISELDRALAKKKKIKNVS